MPKGDTIHQVAHAVGPLVDPVVRDAPAERVGGNRPAGLARLQRVGHKGAEALAPGNTRESFRAALDAGVDMIEFDVLRLRDGAIVLAHDYEDAAGRECMTLEEGLDLFSDAAYAGVALDVDLKLRNYEREVVFSLLERGLDRRSIVSTSFTESLSVIGKLAPGLPRGWSIPRARRDWTKTMLAPGAYAVLRLMRRQLPGRARIALRSGQCEALMVHWCLASRELVESVHEAGGRVFCWTVDDVERIALLDELGVDGVITDDPRLFDSLPG
jgi:glycerophosphoryl diester phosphodiesterase